MNRTTAWLEPAGHIALVVDRVDLGILHRRGHGDRRCGKAGRRPYGRRALAGVELAGSHEALGAEAERADNARRVLAGIERFDHRRRRRGARPKVVVAAAVVAEQVAIVVDRGRIGSVDQRRRGRLSGSRLIAAPVYGAGVVGAVDEADDLAARIDSGRERIRCAARYL